jgi:molybdopterin/thiamine biosynthesis adenylyltransferase
MKKPRIKACYSIARDPNQEGVLHIGMALGHASVIENADEPLTRLLALLDGEHTVEEIVAILQHEQIEASEEDVWANLRVLEEYGFLEDAAIQAPAGLSADEWLRYDRQLLFFSMFEDKAGRRYEYQRVLKKSRVVILGLGGLGSHVLYHLAAAGVGNILGVDFDNVELSNLNRQVLYSTPDVGRPKTSVARERVTALNPHVNFEERALRISAAEDLHDLINGQDLVIAAADTPPGWIRRWINHTCLALQVPYISGGYTEQVGRMGPLMIPFQTSCYDCHCFPEGRALPGDSDNILHQQRGVPSIGPLLAMMGGFIALEAIKYLTGFAPPVTINKVYIFDVNTMEIRSQLLNERSSSCPSCGLQVRREMGRQEERLIVL